MLSRLCSDRWVHEADCFALAAKFMEYFPLQECIWWMEAATNLNLKYFYEPVINYKHIVP